MTDPTASSSSATQPTPEVQRTRWTYGDHANQYAELFRPTSGVERGVVVLLHGGFWRGIYYADQTVGLAVDLVSRGFAAWNLEYRGVGDGGGWPATFADVAAGIDLLADAGDLNLDQVITVGHSAGGQLAVWAAARAGLPASASGSAPVVAVTGAVSMAGVLDLTTAAQTGLGGGATTDLLGGGPDDVPDRYAVADPMRRLPLGVPTVAVHARDDDVVPFGYSEGFVAAATAAGDRSALVEVYGGHFDVIDPATDAWGAVAGAVTALVAG